MKIPNALVLALLVAPAIAGCDVPEATRVSNPLKTGAVLPNHLAKADSVLETSAGLPPGSLMQEATIAVFDNIRLCFDVTLRADEKHASLANPKGWRPSLAARPMLVQGIGVSWGDEVAPTKEKVGNVEVVKGGGRVCFVHGNKLDQFTQLVVLGLDDPSDPNHKLGFRFFLD